MPRRLRIGHQLSARIDGDPVAAAVRAEQLGFDIVLAADHVGPGWAPMPTLSTIASVTERIRLGTLVPNNDTGNPVQLAWEVSTMTVSPVVASSWDSVPGTPRASTTRRESSDRCRPSASSASPRASRSSAISFGHLPAMSEVSLSGRLAHR
jgi:hypothetical protein